MTGLHPVRPNRTRRFCLSSGSNLAQINVTHFWYGKGTAFQITVSEESGDSTIVMSPELFDKFLADCVAGVRRMAEGEK